MLGIRLGDKRDLEWAQATVEKHHYLHQTVEVVYCGDRNGATSFIAQNGGLGRVIVGGTATAGDAGTIIIKRWNGKRYRFSVGYVGEDGISPNTPYRLDDNGNFVRVDQEAK